MCDTWGRCVEALSAGGKVRVETVVLQDGEQYKSMEELGKVFDAALTARLDRQVPPPLCLRGLVTHACGAPCDPPCLSGTQLSPDTVYAVYTHCTSAALVPRHTIHNSTASANPQHHTSNPA